MSLREQALQNSFNPEKDNINSAQGLPAGDYTMAVESVEHNDHDSTVVKSTVAIAEPEDSELVGNDYVGRKDVLFLSLNETDSNNKPLSPFIIDKEINTIKSFTHAVGIQITDDAWDNTENLTTELEPCVGTMFNMKLTYSPNKKNPSNPYKNYEFSKYVEDPNADSVVDVKDEDIPSFDSNDAPF